MRFGHDFHRRIVPAWHRYYVDYNLLKRLAKPPLDGPKVYNELQASLDKLEAFFKLRLRITDAADEELCELFDLTLQSASIPDADRVCPFELTLLLEAFHEFRQDLRTLQWLERVNTEAVDRILAKLGRRDDADSPSYRSICARWEPLRTGWDRDLALRLSRYDALIADASDGLRDPQRVGRKSLYFLRYLQQCSALRPSVDQYLRTIFSDDSQDASGVIKWQHDADDLLDVSDRQIADLCSEMLRYQVMLRPANTSPSLIPDDVRERMLITDQTLKWGILAMGRRQKLDSSPDTVPHRRHRSQPGLQLQLLRDILQSCREERRPDVLLARDSLGRLPLHHAAIYGVTGHGDSDMDMFVPKDVEVEIRDPADPSSDFEGSRDPDFGLLGLMEIERLTSSEPDLVRKDGKLDAADKRGWNPLFHACALGQYDLVKRLLQLGCSQTATDDLGWTAQEYAVLHGHLAVAALFESGHLLDATKGPARPPAPTVAHPKLHCAEGERIIVASLGTERVDDFVTEVNLSYCSSVYDPRTYSGISYNLEVSAPGSAARPRLVRLPILDDQINDPFVFPIPATVEPQLMFKIIRQGAGADGQDIMVGSGTALLENNTRQLGAGRQSLIREQTIAILDKNTMAAVGTVTFTFMVANHFAHLQTPRQVVARKAGEPPTLIGHRGLGMNLKRHDYLQIGENTVESFLSAVKLGAPFVEFDYQVTKDHEAVIFHDFSLSQSGTDVPLQDVTLDQFMYAGDIQSPHGNPLSVLGPIHSKEHPGVERRRARSVGSHFEAGAVQIRDRMKHTADYKLKGFKPNTRGDFIQDSFATLKELLLQVPEDVGFDIEIKYPRLHEARDAGVAPVATELNTFVDIALRTIHQHGGTRRPIIFSSFTPEICILLSLKQKAYPVFFITNAGRVPMVDMERRAASVQVAVRFAQRWNLAGVVFSCEALLLAPRMVGYVKNRGLVCASYGMPNNVPENVRRQAEAGVDIIIADRVRVVAETLAALPVPN